MDGEKTFLTKLKITKLIEYKKHKFVKKNKK